MLITSCFVGSFDEFPLFESGARTDEGDEVWGVDGTPAGLCGLDELERHGYAGSSRSRALGDSLPQPNGGKGRLGLVVRKWIQCSAG